MLKGRNLYLSDFECQTIVDYLTDVSHVDDRIKKLIEKVSGKKQIKKTVLKQRKGFYSK